MATLSASVAQTLVSSFISFAQLSVDRAETPKKESYEKVLHGLQVAAPQAGSVVVERIMMWRDSALRQARSERNELYSKKKQLVANAVGIESIVFLARLDPEYVPQDVYRRLESLSFEILLDQGYHSDGRFPELQGLRERVLLAFSEALGCVSVGHLNAVTDTFLLEMGRRIKADSNSLGRQQLYWVLQGMRFIQLRGDTPEQLQASANFLDRCHPLKHVATDKKSRLQQAICEMLTAVLLPLAEGGGDMSSFGAGAGESRRAVWLAALRTLRMDLLKWVTKQSKQVLSGLPTVTVLSCMEEGTTQLKSALEGVVGTLHKHLKDKRNAVMATQCVNWCVGSFLRRLAPKGEVSRGQLTEWTAWAAMPVIVGAARGGTMAPEHQELVRQLCARVALHLPDLAMTKMTLELLGCAEGTAANWDAAMAGAMAMLSMLAAVPAMLAGVSGEALVLDRAAASITGVWLPPPEAGQKLLELLRAGYNPFEAYGAPHLLPKATAGLSRALAACMQQCGAARLTNPTARVVSDAVARERTAVLPVLVMSLQCVPYLLPPSWREGRGMEELLGLTTHMEQPVRQVATAVVMRMMRALPALRDVLVGACATFVSRTPEDYTEVIKEGCQLLLSLLREWGMLSQAEREAGAAGDPPTSGGAGGGAFGSLPRVEGAALCLLCHCDVAIRKLAVEVLHAARELHGTLSQRQLSRHSTAQSQEGGVPQKGLSGGWGGARGGPSALTRRTSHQSEHSMPSTPGGSANLGADVAGASPFVADVIESCGAAVAERGYWDFGRWSDLWGPWGPLPGASPGATFELCMVRSSNPDDQQRWARLLSGMMREVWDRCERSAAAAHAEMSSKLQALLTPDSSSRTLLPQNDSRLDMSRCYCLSLTAAPLSPDRASATRELVRMMVANARLGSEAQAGVAVLALGNSHPSCHALVCSEASAIMDDYLDRGAQRSLSNVAMGGMSRASRARRDELRLVHANLLRVLAGNVPQGSMMTNQVVRDRLLDWVRETYRHVTTVTDTSLELQQLRHCLGEVARHCGLQLGGGMPQAFPAAMRRQLFDLFSLWCELGQPPGQYRHELSRSVASLKARLKDPEAGRVVEVEMADCSQSLEFVAYLGMAAMLNGPAFGADVKAPAGPVLGWIDRMLSHPPGPAPSPVTPRFWGPPEREVTAGGLQLLLVSNPGLAPVFVDKAYSAVKEVAAGYFQVLSEVYRSQPLPLPQEVLLSLVLHKVVDPRQQVRDAARTLLSELSRREWGRESRYSEQGSSTAGGTASLSASREGSVGFFQQGNPLGRTLVVGVLHDSQHTHQLRLSARLAAEHADLAEPLALEVLARQLAYENGPDALLCLCSWLDHVTLPSQWAGQRAEQLLQLIYDITARHGERSAFQVQRLWRTLGSNKRNVAPILDFIIDRGLRECSSAAVREGGGSHPPCAAGRAVALYISRVAPAHTIDSLVHEVAQQMSEGGVAPFEVYQPSTPKILEYHDDPPPDAAPHLSRTSLSASGGSRPTTPGHRIPSLAPLKSHSAWSESSFTSSMAGGAVGGEGSVKGGGNPGGGGQLSQSSPGSRRNSDVKSWDRRYVALRRPELALCLLSELAYQHDEELRRHLPALLHTITLNADSVNVVVREECCRLLTYLLYSLAGKHLEAQGGTGAAWELQQVTAFIEQLQSRRGDALWVREQPSLTQPLVSSARDVAAFVQQVVQCFCFDTALRERWCGEALRWACCAASRHFASRSHQVFCALSPTLSSESCTALLRALHRCLQVASPQSLDTAAEVLCTLRTLLGNLGAGKVLLFPQVTLAAVALLCSTVVRVGQLALGMLLELLPQLDLGDPTVQQTLLALLPPDLTPAGGGGGDENTPPRNPNRLDRTASLIVEDSHDTLGNDTGEMAARMWPLGQGLLSKVRDVSEDLGPWVALPQLLVKALFQPETQLLALEVLAAIGRQIGQAPRLKRSALGVGLGGGFFCSTSLADSLLGADGGAGEALGVESVVGDAEVGLAVSLGAALPWLWVHISDGAVAGTTVAFLEGMSAGCATMGWSDLSATLAALAGMAGLDADPGALLGPLCQCLCRALFPEYARLVCQRLMEVAERGGDQYKAAAVAVLKVVFEVPGVDLGDASWFGSSSKFITVLSALVDSQHGPAVLDLFQAMMTWQGSADEARGQQSAREGLEWPHCMDDLGESNKLCLEALARVLEACPPPRGGGAPPAGARGGGGGAGRAGPAAAALPVDLAEGWGRVQPGAHSSRGADEPHTLNQPPMKSRGK